MGTRRTGDIGEYFVLYRLVEEGFIAALAPKINTKEIDLLVATETGRPAAIQVKTRGAKSSSWFLKKRHGFNKTAGLFFALVDMGEDPYGVFVIPARELARIIEDSHESWNRTPPTTKRPKTRREEDGSDRRIYSTFPASFGNVPGCPPGWIEEYRDRWDLLREWDVS